MNTTKNIIYIIVVVFLYVIVYFSMYSPKLLNYLDENWRDIRCYPHILPIAGLSKIPKGSNFFSRTYGNFNHCTSNIISKVLSIVTKPLFLIIGGIAKAVNGIKNIVDTFRNMSKVVREMFAALVENTVKRMSNSYAAITYFQEKLKLLIKKQSAMFEVLNQFSATLPFLMYTFTHGPIPRFAYWLKSYLAALIALVVVCLVCVTNFWNFAGWIACPICLICFPGDTKIQMNNDIDKEIKNIKLGDNTKGGIVTGKLYVKKHLTEIYDYKGVKVTGSHLVFDNNKWKRIEETENDSCYMMTELYCLITSSNNIFINNLKFRDYQETKDPDINLLVNYHTVSSLNKNNKYVTTPEDIKNLYYWGFDEDTEIKIGDKYKKIKDIIINIENEDEIYGYVELNADDVIMYNYNGITVSGNTLVKDINDLWCRIFQIKSSVKIQNKKSKIYNLITKDNIITIRNKLNEIFEFRDFIESQDESANDKIDKLVESRLNFLSKKI